MNVAPNACLSDWKQHVRWRWLRFLLEVIYKCEPRHLVDFSDVVAGPVACLCTICFFILRPPFASPFVFLLSLLFVRLFLLYISCLTFFLLPIGQTVVACSLHKTSTVSTVSNIQKKQKGKHIRSIRFVSQSCHVLLRRHPSCSFSLSCLFFFTFCLLSPFLYEWIIYIRISAYTIFRSWVFTATTVIKLSSTQFSSNYCTNH